MGDGGMRSRSIVAEFGRRRQVTGIAHTPGTSAPGAICLFLLIDVKIEQIDRRYDLCESIVQIFQQICAKFHQIYTER
jgi:hypothetical protein